MAAKRAKTKRPSASDTLAIAGLSAKARTAIGKAARKQRLSVDAWAAQALTDAAQSTLAGGGDQMVLAELRKMSRKLDKLASRPKPLEKTLDQVQKSVHDLRDHMHTVYEEARERGGETIDEVRTRTGTVVDEMSDKASETLSQWRKTADQAMHGLQRNLDDLRHTVFRAESLKPAKAPPAAAPKKTSVRKPAGTAAAPKKTSVRKPAGTAAARAGRPPKAAQAKPAGAKARAKPGARSAAKT